MVSRYQCCGTNVNGKRCRNKNKKNRFCSVHQNQRDEIICSICLENYKNKRTLDCSHSFCKNCICHWICSKPNCPMCREPISSGLRRESLRYGIRHKLLVVVKEYVMDISSMTFEDQETLIHYDIVPGHFMNEPEWTELWSGNLSDIYYRIPQYERRNVLSTSDPSDHDFFTEYNNVYLFR